MTSPASTACVVASLTILGVGLLLLPIPTANAPSLTFILGALAGALTLQGTARPASPADSDRAPAKDPE